MLGIVSPIQLKLKKLVKSPGWNTIIISPKNGGCRNNKERKTLKSCPLFLILPKELGQFDFWFKLGIQEVSGFSAI